MKNSSACCHVSIAEFAHAFKIQPKLFVAMTNLFRWQLNLLCFYDAFLGRARAQQSSILLQILRCFGTQNRNTFL